MEPCYQGSKIPTDCWNIIEHVLLTSQSQWSLPIHQHCSIGCTRCTGSESSVFKPCLWQRDSFSVLWGACPIFSHSFLSCSSTACCSEGQLSDHCSATWSHAWQLQFPISASLEPWVLFKRVLLITQQPDHRHHTSATRSSFFSDTWEYCQDVNDVYLLRALRAVCGVQEQESMHF